MATNSSDTCHNRYGPFIDIHGHASLKCYLFDHVDLWKQKRGIFGPGSRRTPAGFNPLSIRSSFKLMLVGGITSTWLAHYVPEPELARDAGLLLSKLARIFTRRFTNKELNKSGYDKLTDMMRIIEKQIEARRGQAVLATDYEDYTRYLDNGTALVFLHTIEGLHSVTERNDDGTIDIGRTIHNLSRLADSGVALVTLAHFYPNELVSQIDAMPECGLIKKLIRFKFGLGWKPDVTPEGIEIIKAIEDLGMLIDLTHCHPDARCFLLKSVTDPGRPIIASHVSVRDLWEHRSASTMSQYCMSNCEIDMIAKRNGGIGLIVMPYWLYGKCKGSGLKLIYRSIQHIRKITGSYKHVMIGTDFDGMTTVPDDLRDYSDLGRLPGYLSSKGLADTAIRDIIGGNALRILGATWGKRKYRAESP